MSWTSPPALGSRPTFRTSCARKGTTDVVVDFSDLRFLSARGVHTVLWADRDAREHGITLQLVVTRRRFVRLFTLLGLDRRLRLRSDLASARRNFTSPAGPPSSRTAEEGSASGSRPVAARRCTAHYSAGRRGAPVVAQG